MKCSGVWCRHAHSVLTQTLWKLLETAVWLPLCEKVAISSLVPGDVAVMGTFFSILSPDCSKTILAEGEVKVTQRCTGYSNRLFRCSDITEVS